MEVPVFYGLSKCQSGQEWWMLRRSITIELLWCIWNGLYGNPKKVAINLANDSAIVIVLWLTNKALWYKIDPEFTLLRWRLELEHYPALVTLLAYGEAETWNLRLVLWGYDWKVEWTQQPKLLRVCAHQRKVDGSNLHMWIFFGSTASTYVFSQLEKELFDWSSMCLYDVFIWSQCCWRNICCSHEGLNMRMQQSTWSVIVKPMTADILDKGSAMKKCNCRRMRQQRWLAASCWLWANG